MCRLLNNDKTSLGKSLLVVRLKVLKLACLQMLPRTLAADAVGQAVQTGFHKDEGRFFSFIEREILYLIGYQYSA
jgi:hypothetical protein